MAPDQGHEGARLWLVTMGRGGPDTDAEGNPKASVEDQQRAIELNRAWPEHFLRLDPITSEAKGLVPEIESAVSVTERHMVIKVWRALWKKMAAMKYCDLEADPSKSFANTPPQPRDAKWLRREVLRSLAS
jgi:hypothetical protein